MAKICSLFSSSSGNCIYIGSSSGGILIDVGVSAKRAAGALQSIGVDIDSIGAIFVTHEHTDHICGIRVFEKNHRKPLYATAGTLEELAQRDCLGDFPTEVISTAGIEVCGMHVRPFKTSHDSRESCGYTVSMPDGRRIAVSTDLGVVTDEVFSAISGCDMVLLESNHDVRMLQAGIYPYPLKKRILSDVGHLSNDACAKTASALVASGTTRLMLGHLSKENNYPPLAFQTTSAELQLSGAVEDSDYILTVASPDEPEMMVL